VVPRYLAVIGSLLDFAGPRIAGRFRKALFRPLSGVVAASLYRRVTGISRLEATLGGAVAGCLYRLTIYGLENLPKHGFLLVANHPCVFDVACSTINRTQLRHAISSEAVAKRLENFAWPKDACRLEEVTSRLKTGHVLVEGAENLCW